MRKFFMYAVFFITAINYSTAQTKCDPTCQLTVGGTVTPAEVAKFKSNYHSVYRNGTLPQKTHSVSVDFSKESINAFYSANFVNPTINVGFNVFFLCLKKPGLPGRRHDDQIGLGIFPADVNCKSNFNGLGIFNNSYNQKKGVYTPTPVINILTQTELVSFQSHYKQKYSVGNPDNYTNRVHFGKDILDALFIFINSNVKYTAIRFELGIYRLPDMACGQKSSDQLTLFISPVLNTGATDYEGLLNFFKLTYANGDKLHMLDTYNHGELCPKTCPE